MKSSLYVSTWHYKLITLLFLSILSLTAKKALAQDATPPPNSGSQLIAGVDEVLSSQQLNLRLGNSISSTSTAAGPVDAQFLNNLFFGQPAGQTGTPVQTTAITGVAAAPYSTSLNNATRLRQLLILEYLFRNNSDGLLDPNGPDLGNLYILNQIFKDPSWFYGQIPTFAGTATIPGKLPSLFTYKKLFDNTGSFGLSPGPDVSLGDILFLDQIFYPNTANPFPIITALR